MRQRMRKDYFRSVVAGRASCTEAYDWLNDLIIPFSGKLKGVILGVSM